MRAGSSASSSAAKLAPNGHQPRIAHNSGMSDAVGRGRMEAAQDASAGAQPTLTAHATAGEQLMTISPSRRWRAWMKETRGPVGKPLPAPARRERGGLGAAEPGRVPGLLERRSGPVETAVRDRLGPEAAAPEAGREPLRLRHLDLGCPVPLPDAPRLQPARPRPVERPKDGIGPLEGLVETDWSVATFTMNWKLSAPWATRSPSRRMSRSACRSPRRGELGNLRPARRHGGGRGARGGLAQLERTARRAAQAQVPRALCQGVAGAIEEWEADYFRGRLPGGASAPEHQTKLRLKPFTQAGPNPDLQGRRWLTAT